MIYEIVIGGSSFRVELVRSDQAWQCRVVSADGSVAEHRVDALPAGDSLSLLISGHSYEIRRDPASGDVILGGQRFPVEVRDPRSLRNRGRGARVGPGAKTIIAPMPGKIVRVLVAEQSQVEAGQAIVVVEAMKMQNELKAPSQGTVTKILVGEGDAVNAGDTLAVIA